MTISPSPRKASIVRTLSFRIAFASSIAVAFVGLLWLNGQYQTFQRDSERLRETYLAEQKALLRNVVQDAVAFAEFERQRIEQRVRALLRQRVDEAAAIAAHLHALHGPEEAGALIREALRPIRFNKGRGYFFAFDTDGIERLFADRPEMEGKNMMAVRGARGEAVVPDMLALVGEKGEGFYRYTWTRPGSGERHFEKLAYVKLFEPLGWVFGTGEYLADMEEDVKHEVLNRMENTRFGDDDYVFAGDWDGVSLSGPAKGRDMWEIEDVNGVKIVQQLVARARDGGGFVEYVIPRFKTSRSAPKISYVEGLAQWQWYVGAGRFVDEIERTIAERRRELVTQMGLNVLLVVAVLAVLVGGIFLTAHRVGARLGENFSSFLGFFEKASTGGASIDPDAMAFKEFEGLARAARDTLAARDDAEERLREKSHQLERSNQDLERFAYVASHDLQEPLRMVASHIQLLQRRLDDRLDEESRPIMGYAVEGAKRMSLMIRDLLAYSKVTHASSLDRVDTEGVVAAVLDNLGQRIRQSEARIEIDTLPPVHGDRGQLVSLFQNLIGNALKYRDPDRRPHIRIGAEPHGTFWAFAIEDNGIGIAPDAREKVFEIFQRLHDREVYEGSGIGLAVGKRIVEHHGGTIRIEDTEGHGCRIVFTLPPASPENFRAVVG